MQRIGLLFSSKEYADKFVNILSLNVNYLKKDYSSENIYSVVLDKYRLFIYICGKGQINAIVGCAKLYHYYDCKMIFSFDSCTWVHSKDKVEIGNIIEFKKNIINYDFKINPDIYHYDDCGISDYLKDFLEQKDLLLTSGSEISSAEVLDNLKLRTDEYSNIYYDSNAYGILAYCEANNLKCKIIRFVKGCSQDIEINVIEKLVAYFQRNEDI